ncbi:protein kinase domain-containing protein [Streptomyces phaeochromogenes]|uniref:serine/threonine-protein kinase n=1 Tax=Streptomyces phaeochromogenes TaxID=1923 RepID=UPI003870BB3F|nr:protein kinase [Streptomyces phaeochromogenes]
MLIAGRYRLRTTIGRGAMGEVWQARDEMLGTDVAVKVLLAQGSDATAAARFRLEAQTAGSLNHRHVVGVLDFGTHEDRLFLVMELVDGDSLRTLSATGPLPAEQVARIAAQTAAGLAVAHQQGIVHRDIKPGNLLLDADGTVKIGDFGIARFLDDPAAALTATGQIVGTSLYLAPERALGRPAGPATDVYSLGCVLYQLLTGQPPFQADTAIAILHHHLDTAPTPPRRLGASLPPAFENYLLRMLAKEPGTRPAAQQVADWFATGAWRGHPQPLPAAKPQRPLASPRPGERLPYAPGPSLPGEPETSAHLLTDPGSATTYALPSSGGHTGSARRTRRRRQPALRDATHRPKLIGAVVAGSVLFLASLLIGMTWLSPGPSSAEPSGTDTPRTTSPTPAAQPSTSPTPSLRPPDAIPTGSPDSGDALEEQPENPPKAKTRKKEHGRKHND